MRRFIEDCLDVDLSGICPNNAADESDDEDDESGIYRNLSGMDVVFRKEGWFRKLLGGHQPRKQHFRKIGKEYTCDNTVVSSIISSSFSSDASDSYSASDYGSLSSASTYSMSMRQPKAVAFRKDQAKITIRGKLVTKGLTKQNRKHS